MGENNELMTQIDEAIEKALSKHNLGGVDDSAAQRELEEMGRAHQTLLDADTEEKTLAFAGFVRALWNGKNDLDRARKIADNWRNQKGLPTKVRDRYNMVKAALNSSTFDQGGALVPTEFAEGIIALLGAKTVLRRAGVPTIQMDTDTLTMAKETAGVTSTYLGEGQNIGESEPTVGDIQLVLKKLATLAVISNDLLRYRTSTNVDQFVRDRMILSMQRKEDIVFLRSLGTAYEPKGLRYLMNSSNAIANVGAWSTFVNIAKDIKALFAALEDNNVPMSRPVWIAHPKTFRFMKYAANTQENYPYKGEISEGSLEGYPIYSTTQIPTNLGGASDTELYLIDVAEVVIGDGINLYVDASGEAAYYDGSNVQAAFSRDQSVIRIISRNDIQLLHDRGAACIKDVAFA